MAKQKPKGKKKSTDKSATLTKLLIINAILQLIKSLVELINTIIWIVNITRKFMTGRIQQIRWSSRYKQ